MWVSSSCGSPPDPTSLEWNKNYDWRFSGKRPQDTEHGKLWPQIAAYIEGKVQKANGKKVSRCPRQSLGCFRTPVTNH